MMLRLRLMTGLALTTGKPKPASFSCDDVLVLVWAPSFSRNTLYTGLTWLCRQLSLNNQGNVLNLCIYFVFST